MARKDGAGEIPHRDRLIDIILACQGDEWLSRIDAFNPPKKAVEYFARWSEENPLDPGAAWVALEDQIRKRPDAYLAPWELDLQIERVKEQLIDVGEADPRRAVAFAEIILDPLRPHRFELDIHSLFGLGNEYAVLDLFIGGDRDLLLAARADRPAITTLSGVVQAATLEGAHRRIERTFDEMIGAMRTLGMCDFGNRYGAERRPDKVVRVSDSWRSAGEPATLGPAYRLRVPSVRFAIPVDTTDLERRHLKSEKDDKFDKALGRHLILVKKVMSGRSERAATLRNACRLAVDAEDADEFGVHISLAFSCLEGLLLPNDKRGDVLARLAEGVAFLLGGGVEDREALRRKVKALYDIRSTFVHTGRVYEGGRDRKEVLDILHQVLRREISFLPDPAEETQADPPERR